MQYMDSLIQGTDEHALSVRLVEPQVGDGHQEAPLFGERDQVAVEEGGLAFPPGGEKWSLQFAGRSQGCRECPSPARYEEETSTSFADVLIR